MCMTGYINVKRGIIYRCFNSINRGWLWLIGTRDNLVFANRSRPWITETQRDRKHSKKKRMQPNPPCKTSPLSYNRIVFYV